MNKLTNLTKNEDVLGALDLLDLDEQLIDDKLEILMKKDTLQHSHLKTILTFIKYKYMISLQEETDCENDIYVKFVLERLLTSREENINILLDILSVSLLLNTHMLQNVAEHILQQLMAVDDVQPTPSPDSQSRVTLKIIDSVLELCISNKVTVNSTFLNHELEKMITVEEKLVSTQFFTKTIPLIISCCQDYSVLNQIWDQILSRVSRPNQNDYVILCTLSEFYLPLKIDPPFSKVQSTIIEICGFWILLRNGFIHEDFSIRKCSIYLARRAIHCAAERKISVNQVGDVKPVFKWNKVEREKLQCSWLALFALLETLEEKQSHLVLSALKLFDQVFNLHSSWYHCALIRAFSHDANAVVQQVIEIALTNSNDHDITVESFPYTQFINALNNTFLYEHIHDYKKNRLLPMLKKFLEHGHNTNNMIFHLSRVSLSPIPKFYLSYALMLVLESSASLKTVLEGFFSSNSPILNNAMIRCANECCFLNFITSRSFNIPKAESLLDLFSTVSTEKLLVRGNMFWNKIIDFLRKCDERDKQTFQDIRSMMDRAYLQNTSDFKSLANLFVIYSDVDQAHFSVFIDFIRILLQSLKDSQSRQYSSTSEFDAYFFIIINAVEIMEPSGDTDDSVGNALMMEVFADNADVLINYLISRLISDLEINEWEVILKYAFGLSVLMNKRLTESTKKSAESLFQKAETILKSTEINTIQKYFSVKILSIAVTVLLDDNSVSRIEKAKKISVYYHLIQDINISKTEEGEIFKGKLLSDLNLAKLQVYNGHYSSLDLWSLKCIMKLHEEVMDLLEIGGHGCMLSIIQLAHLLLPHLLITERMKDIKIVIERIWKELFELRKNDQFKICFKAFIKMLYQSDLFASKLIKSTLLEYGEKIFELGDQIPFVVLELVENLSCEAIKSNMFPFTPLLNQALTFGMVLRKDQRIEIECCEFITSQNQDFLIPEEVKYIVNPVPRIRSAALQIFAIQNKDLHASITLNLRNKLDITYKPSNRYHGNSLHHRFLLRTLQSLLFSFKVQPDGPHLKGNVQWCIQRLVSQPHHVSSRIMLEWYISLYIIQNSLPLSSKILSEFDLSSIPQISYFLVIFHVLKHRISSPIRGMVGFTTQVYNDFTFAMQTYLPHTMGQLFNIRLHAQYLTLKLNEMMKNDPICNKYQLMCDTIRHTFHLSCTEKNLIKIKDDFYINDFNVIYKLNVNNIFHYILRNTGVAQDEWIFGTSSNETEEQSDSSSGYSVISDKNETQPASEIEISEIKTTNIQRKFVPWKNVLAELGITPEHITENKKSSNLIVVASLIDRLPNLGGLARTCEVFGVKEYVINSLKHLQDKQFQTLSVSSERWLNIIEVKPGNDLKNHLIEMKKKGYNIVGAEQTSSSVSLDDFVFPINSLLLVGHEKEGIPCDLLNLVDYCVEIPQYGLVRSLNVHVTASIFIREYTRQHS